jgi:glucosamine--fructose-6-phosphate aminotransferase (isomerizing)
MRTGSEGVTDEPVLRDGPPWVMDDMIEAQRGLAAGIAASPAAQALSVRLRAVAAAGGPIVLTGCGTSEHAARAIHAMLAGEFELRPISVRDAFEASLEPPSTGLVVGISHEAGTAATLTALTRAASAGAEAVLITARPDQAPGGIGVVGTPVLERSWCHTVAYVSPMLVYALFAGLSVERADEIITTELDARAARHDDAVTLARCRRLLVVASGVDEVTASELALKIEEAVHVPATPLGAEKVLHGHLPAADRETGLVVLRFDPRDADARDELATRVGDACRVLEMPTVTLSRHGLLTRAEALLAGALALQLLTAELSTVLGVAPDLIRREDSLYRKMAEIGAVG